MQPILTWPGRDRAPRPDPAPLPAQPTERHPAVPGPGTAGTAPGRLYHGDNLAVMAGLRAELEDRVDLIYIDPPFGSQDRYVHRAGGAETLAYDDRWAGGMAEYLDMLWPRLRLMHALLSPRGALYVHLDAAAAHYVKVLLDELFDPGCFQREIIWRIGWISGYKSAVRNWVRNHDTILYYTKHPRDFTFNKCYVPHPPGYARRGGGEGPGRPIEDVWNANAAEHALHGAESLDSIQIKSFSSEKTGFETQKNLSLLRRIVAASSNPGDLVADFFCGSGTALVAAEGLGRRWIGCDASPAAIAVTRSRLLALAERGPFDLFALPSAGRSPGGTPAAAGEALPREADAPCNIGGSAAPGSRSARSRSAPG